MLKAMFVLLVAGFAVLVAGPVEASERGEAEAAALRAAVEAVVAEAVGHGVMQSGVAQSGRSPSFTGWSTRRNACSSAQSEARADARSRCNGDYSTGECFDCFNDGDRDDPDWSCSVRWSCN